MSYLANHNLGPVAAASLVSRAARSTRPARISYTSPAIRGLLEDLTARRMNELDAAREAHQSADTADEELVDIQVSISEAHDAYAGSDVWCVKLRVRRGKVSYVIKNISEFMRACQSGAVLSYGKNLSFAHIPTAFTERARHVLAVIERVAASQSVLFRSRWRYQEAGHGTGIKDLPMSDADLIDLFDALEGTTITFDLPWYAMPSSYSNQKPKALQLTVVAGNPAITVSMTAAGKGGYDLSVEGARCCFAAEGRMYVLDDAHAWRCTDEFSGRVQVLLPPLLAAQGAMHIAPEDLPAFTRDALPLLRSLCQVDVPLEVDELTPPEATFSFRIASDDGRITCDAIVAYGTWEYALYGPGLNTVRSRTDAQRTDAKSTPPTRDLVAEYRAMNVVESFFPGGMLKGGELLGFDEDDDELLFDLMTQGLVELSAMGEVLLSERLRAIEVRDSPQVSVRATARSGLLDVALDMSGMMPQDIAAYLASYKRRQKFVRLSNGDIMRLGEGARVVGDLAEALGVDAEDLTQGVSGLPTNHVLFVDRLVKREHGARARCAYDLVRPHTP